MERWDHSSLLAGGTSPAKASLAAPECDDSWDSEPGSPLADGWTHLDSHTFRTQLEPTVRHSGWLLKAYGAGPLRQWRRRYVYVLADRLCYTADPGEDGGHAPLRYLPLDRIPIRALPRGYGPKLGVTLVEDRQMDRSSQQLSPRKAGCVFSVACGSHTHFFAAPSQGEAKAWVAAITECWVGCVKHTARGTHMPSAAEVLTLKEAHWQAENEALRRSLAEAEQQRLRESTARWQAAAAAAAQTVQQEGLPVTCYEIEVETGSQPGAGTTARVYVELCGTGGSSGDHRLMYREAGSAAPRTAFAEGAVDRFKLHCQPLGEVSKVRVYHSNGGASPAWFLREVRVRQQGAPRWTHFPCGRWLAVDQDDSRVLRELFSDGQQPQADEPSAAPSVPLQQAAPAERVVHPVWYTAVVCTGAADGAGLAPAEGATVHLTLHGSRGSSARVRLPSQPGDFERGQEGVFRVQLPGVGSLEKLTVGLSSGGQPASWLLDLVEVTDGATGETVYFPCTAWLGASKGAEERSLLGSRTDPRAAHREATRLRQQLEAASRQLAASQAELEAAKAAARAAQHAGQGHSAELEVRLATLEAEVGQLRKLLAEAQQRATDAEARVQQLQQELSGVQARAEGLRREQDAQLERAGGDAAPAADLARQLRALQDELAAAEGAAAAAGARARRFEAEAARGEDELRELRGLQEHSQRHGASRVAQAEEQVRRLQAEVGAGLAELRDAKAAEREAAEECDRLGRELAAERLRAKERAAELERLQKDADRAAEAPQAAPASAKLLASYRVCIRTSSEPAQAGTALPVCLELLGSGGSTGPIRLGRTPSGSCFGTGASDVFQAEAPAVGELQQANIWLDVEAADSMEGAPSGARWHLDTLEVASEGRLPTYFVCRQWLDARCQHRAQLVASSRNPRQEEAEYKVVVHTSSLAGCGTAGNVFLDLRGDRAPSGVLTLRNKGGTFRPGQADEFAFHLPRLGSLVELRVGHNGRKEWHLDGVEVLDAAGGTTFFFPCEQWIKGSGTGASMHRALQLRGYTTDPRSLPVRYRVEAAVEEVTGWPAADSLRLTLCGSRGEGQVQRLDASRAEPGRPLVALFESANVGSLERLRIGLAPGQAGQRCGLRLSSVQVTNMPSGEAAAFHCSKWLRSEDPYDYEVDAAGEQEELACTYRLEVQTSDVRRAGTGGNVFVTVVGDACTIGPYQLPNVEAEHFQRGQLDVFEIEGAPDCGQLRQIEVRHDGARRGNDWHLSWVRVCNLATGALAMFKCKRWVDRRRQEDAVAVGAAAPLPPDAAAAAGGRLTAKDWLLAAGGVKAAAAAAALRAPIVQGVPMEAEAPGGSSLEHTEAAAEQGPAPGPECQPGYRVVFHTSRGCCTGTKAKVHLELTGAGGSSGVLHPRGTSKSFGAGRVDIFEYPQLPWLGELQSARVGTDASGLFPAWHLQLLVVTHMPTGRVWQFSCFNWIDKRANYSRWLTLDSAQEGGYCGSALGASSKLGAAWQSPYGLKAAPLQGGARGGQAAAGNGAGPGSPSSNSPMAAQGSPTGRAVRYKQQQTAARPGSPIRVPVRQPWGGGSPASPSAVQRSGSGMPGSPLIGARRLGSGR